MLQKTMLYVLKIYIKHHLGSPRVHCSNVIFGSKIILVLSKLIFILTKWNELQDLLLSKLVLKSNTIYLYFLTLRNHWVIVADTMFFHSLN